MMVLLKSFSQINGFIERGTCQNMNYGTFLYSHKNNANESNCIRLIAVLVTKHDPPYKAEAPKRQISTGS